MKIIICGDVHNHGTENELWLSAQDYDKVIFLGDYFDSYGDNPKMTQETALWLKWSMDQPDRVHLWGNHDIPYFFSNNNFLTCPGYTPEKRDTILEILSDYKDKFNTFYSYKDYLFSHAGISESLFPCHPITGFDLLDCQLKLEQDWKGLLKHRKFNPIFLYSLLWLRPSGLRPIPEYTQFVGHTQTSILNPPTGNPMYVDGIWFLDCLENWVGVIEDDKVYALNKNDGSVLYPEEASGTIPYTSPYI